MRRRRSSGSVGVLAAVVLLLPGCASATDGQARAADRPAAEQDTSTTDGDLDGWVAEFCTALEPLAELAEPDAGGVTTPAELQEFLVDYLTSSGEVFDGVAGAVSGLGDPPIDGADGLTSQFASAVGGVGDLFDDFAERAQALDPTDVEGFQTLADDLQAVDVDAAFDTIGDDAPAELDAAFGASPTCTDLGF